MIHFNTLNLDILNLVTEQTLSTSNKYDLYILKLMLSNELFIILIICLQLY